MVDPRKSLAFVKAPAGAERSSAVRIMPARGAFSPRTTASHYALIPLEPEPTPLLPSYAFADRRASLCASPRRTPSAARHLGVTECVGFCAPPALPRPGARSKVPAQPAPELSILSSSGTTPFLFPAYYKDPRCISRALRRQDRPELAAPGLPPAPGR